MLAYSIVVATALIGLVGLPWWMASVGALGLMLVSMSEHIHFRVRSSRATTSQVLSMSSLASAVNSGLASGGAFLLGKASAVIWGV
jgi:hypothetical protein